MPMFYSKIKKAGLLLMLLFVYIMVGGVTPLFHTPVMSQQTIEQQLPVKQFYSDKVSIDRAMLLESNQSAWTERIRLLNQAQEQIVFTTFDMRDSSSTQDLLSILLQKANQGVSVKILVDGLNGWYHLEQSSIFRAFATHENVEIKLYNPINVIKPWMNQYRLHDKYIIVDDLGYIVGGRNTHDYFIGNYDSTNMSLDREVLIYNTCHQTEQSKHSSLLQLQQYFDYIWNSDYCQLYGETAPPSLSQEKQLRALQSHYLSLVSQNIDLFQDLDFVKRTVPVNRITLLYNNPDTAAKEPVIFHQLCQLMGQAQEQVTFFTPYAVCNTYMLQKLQAISAQVPDCRIVVNSVENGDNIVASSDYIKHKEDLLQSGFAIYEYDGGTSTHGKSLTIDDRLSIIGSYNLDLRSTYLSTELMLVMDSTALTEQLNKNFHKMERDCRQLIGPDEYIVPDGLEIAEVSHAKRLVWWVLGVVLHPFRLMI